MNSLYTYIYIYTYYSGPVAAPEGVVAQPLNSLCLFIAACMFFVVVSLCYYLSCVCPATKHIRREEFTVMLAETRLPQHTLNRFNIV